MDKTNQKKNSFKSDKKSFSNIINRPQLMPFRADDEKTDNTNNFNDSDRKNLKNITIDFSHIENKSEIIPNNNKNNLEISLKENFKKIEEKKNEKFLLHKPKPGDASELPVEDDVDSYKNFLNKMSIKQDDSKSENLNKKINEENPHDKEESEEEIILDFEMEIMESFEAKKNRKVKFKELIQYQTDLINNNNIPAQLQDSKGNNKFVFEIKDVEYIKDPNISENIKSPDENIENNISNTSNNIEDNKIRLNFNNGSSNNSGYTDNAVYTKGTAGKNRSILRNNSKISRSMDIDQINRELEKNVDKIILEDEKKNKQKVGKDIGVNIEGNEKEYNRNMINTEMSIQSEVVGDELGIKEKIDKIMN